MLKVVAIFGAVFFFSVPAFAGGSIPAVNSDMGCTAAGQTVNYNGSALSCGGPPQSNVASLPTCNSGTEGAIYEVTNALTPVALSAVAGGGAIHVLVFCNGSSWLVL